MNFSYNGDKNKVAFAGKSDINASYKDLGAVCESIRYKSIPYALKVLNDVINEDKPIRFRKHNKGMGSRHELGGNKGRYPKRCAKIVKNILSSAVANAINKGFDETKLVVIHTSANKNDIIMRTPPKGNLSWGRGMYGYSSLRRSDLEFAKVEIGVANPEDIELSKKAKDLIHLFGKHSERLPADNEKSKKAKPKSKKAKDESKDKEPKTPKLAEEKKEISNEKAVANSTKPNVNNKPIKNTNLGNDRY